MNIIDLTQKIRTDLSSLAEEDFSQLPQFTTEEMISVFKSLSAASEEQNNVIWPVFSSKVNKTNKEFSLHKNKKIEKILQRNLLERLEGINERAIKLFREAAPTADEDEMKALFNAPNKVITVLEQLDTPEAKALAAEKKAAAPLAHTLYYSLEKLIQKLVEQHDPHDLLLQYMGLDNDMEGKKIWKEDTKIQLLADLLERINKAGIGHPKIDPNKGQVSTHMVSKGEVINATKGPLRDQIDKHTPFAGCVDIIETGLKYESSPGEPNEESQYFLDKLASFEAGDYSETKLRWDVVIPLYKYLQATSKEQITVFKDFVPLLKNKRDQYYGDLLAKVHNAGNLGSKDVEQDSDSSEVMDVADESNNTEEDIQKQQVSDKFRKMLVSRNIPEAIVDVFLVNANLYASNPDQEAVNTLPSVWRDQLERTPSGYILTTKARTLISKELKKYMASQDADESQDVAKKSTGYKKSRGASM